MPISGLVIKVDPVQRDTIVSTLQDFEHVELIDTPEDEPLVVVLDVESMQEEQDLFKRINDVPGVHNVTLSYHNFEDLSEEQLN